MCKKPIPNEDGIGAQTVAPTTSEYNLIKEKVARQRVAQATSEYNSIGKGKEVAQSKWARN